MKTLQLIAASLLLNAAIFTGCKKAQYDANPIHSANSTTSSEIISGSEVTLSEGQGNPVTATNSLSISSGYLNTSYLSVFGNQQMIYESKEPKRIDLFRPLQAVGVPIPAAYYANLTMKMATIGGATHGVYLKGSVKIDDDILVPVEIIIDNVQINAVPKLEYITQNTTMITMMNMGLDRIGMNISQEMWLGARSNTPIITISATQNPELYRMVLANMNSMMHIGGNSEGISTTGNASM